MAEIVSVGLKPLSEAELVVVRRATAFMFALLGERAEMMSLLRGAGSHFDYEVTNDLHEYREVLRELSPRFVVEGELEEGEPSFQVEGLLGWEPRVEPGMDYYFDAVVRVAELMLGREFNGWETEECDAGFLCSCRGVLDCPSRIRLIRFLKEARAHTKFVGSESVVAVLSAIQDGLANPWELPRPDGYDSEPYHKIWAWRGDDYIDGALIPWACRRLGIWHEGDYSLTKQMLSMAIEEEGKPAVVTSEETEGLRSKDDGELEPVGEGLEQVNVQTAGAKESVGTLEPSNATGVEVVETPRRRGWFRKLLGV